MKKILFVSTIPLSFKAFNLELFKLLQGKKMEVHAAAAEGEEITFLEEKGVVFHKVDISRKIDFLRDIKALISLSRLIKKEKFDIVHSQTSKAGVVARAAAKIMGVPVIVHNVGGWSFNEFVPGYKKRIYLFIEKCAARCCDMLIAVSEFVRQDGLSNKICSEKKIALVYNGVDTSRFKPVSIEDKMNLKKEKGIAVDSKIVGVVSRLVADKGIETFIEVAKILKEERSLFFVVVGEGNKMIEYQEKVKEGGVDSVFMFAGKSFEVEKWMNIFDVFFLPTLREGFGVVFAEAQASGIPVVGTDIPALREVVQKEKSGFLLGVDDIEGMASKIKVLLNNILCANMGKIGREHVIENFSASENSMKIYRIYQKIWERKFKKELKED